MIVSRIKLRNWRNFPHAEARFGDVTYLVGANASGKSNFLDVFRFLRDIAKAEGGGLQKAVADRGGISKVRCLHARKPPEISIELEVSDKAEDLMPVWKYVLELDSEKSGYRRAIITKEEVFFKLEDGKYKNIISRPNNDDKNDKELLTETYLEHIQSNKDFRPLVELIASTTYLHLVPQLIKHANLIGGTHLESDPFGQALMERIAKTPEKARGVRLARIQKALAAAIPQFEEIRFVKDTLGRPHLEAKYTHHRPLAGWQREDQFSDGTLRLIAIFWLLLDGDNMLLLEEPELSLDEEIIRQFPRMIELLHRSRKKARRQIIITTHSSALLNDLAIDSRFVLRVEAAKEGSEIREPSQEDKQLITDGFSAAEIILPKVHPKKANQMELF